MKILFTICLSVISVASYAQYDQNYRNFGDKAFANKDYYEAAFYYRKAADNMHLTKKLELPFQSMNKKPKDGKSVDALYVSYQLAESYRLYENYLEAEGWYYKVSVTGDSKYPLATLWYGVCLRANQHFDEGIKELNQFLSSYKTTDKYTAIANKEIANCNFAKEQYEYPHLLEVAKMTGGWNSDGSDYSVNNRDSIFYFTSSRIASDDKKHLNRIYWATAASKPQIIPLAVEDHKKETEYGTPALTSDGKRMYFTQWYKEGAKTIHAIYFTDKQGTSWSQPKKLNSNVNADGFNSIQPFVAGDGTKLFFASNKPGGQGGDDIWVSDLGTDGDATNSTNLGDVINTPMDEQAPYYNAQTKKLIYSSKGFTGLGGFDFFESNNNMGAWTAPLNMGYPMNSAKDDLYFWPDKSDSDKFYISSDRQSDCCLNLFEVHDKSFILTGIVTDCETLKPLPGVAVTLRDSISKKILKQFTTAADAKYAFIVDTRRPLNIILEKKGYFTKILPVPFTGKMSNDSLYNPGICLQAFEKDKPIVIKNVLYDFNRATLRPESKTVLHELVTLMNDNPKIIVELGSHTDSVGSEKYNLKLSQARAQACVDFIISEGIGEKRIFAKGYGKSRPIAPNSLPNGKDNPDGRQLNRRTEFTVVKTE